MKKRVFFILLVVSFLFLPLVSAASLTNAVADAVQSTINAAITVFDPVIKQVMGDYKTGDFLFAKFLLFLLLFIVINTVIKKMPVFENQRGVSFLIAIIVAIFSVRFISQNQLIQGILLPYGTLGVALSTLFPFLIFFYFIHTNTFSSTGRRIYWIFFIIVFFILWTYKSNEISEISNQIYVWSIIGMIIVFIFDKNIHGYFETVRAEKMKRNFKLKQLADLEADLNKYRGITNPSETTRRLIRRLEQRYDELLREL